MIDCSARDELIMENMHIARSISRRRFPPACANCDDCEAAGYLGLVKAAAHFDPAGHPGVPFSAYCRLWIKAACTDHCYRCWRNDWKPLSVDVVDSSRPEAVTADDHELVDLALASLEPRERAEVEARYFNGHHPRGCTSTRWRLLQRSFTKMRFALQA